jgi:hypothetical protein
MAIPFSPRAALCTLAVVGGLAAAITAQLPGGLFGLTGMDRDGLLLMEGGGQPREQDDRDIVSAVLAHEARKPDRGPVCVQLADEGEALASERGEIDTLQRAVANAAPAQRAALVAEIDRRRNPARLWVRLGGEGGALSDENVRQLRLAEASVLGAPASARVDITLDMSGLPEALRSTARNCPALAFTAPALAGEIAFVETRFAPPGQPAEAWLYAVVRTDGRWAVEAMVRT